MDYFDRGSLRLMIEDVNIHPIFNRTDGVVCAPKHQGPMLIHRIALD